MNTLLNNLRITLEDLICPAHCAYCKCFMDAREPLCVQCLKKIQPRVSISLTLSKKKTIKLFSAGAYQEPLRSLILAKHARSLQTSSLLGTLIWRLTPLEHQVFDYIVPVPLHWSRYAWRWFNQAEVIAQKIAHLSGKPMVNLLQRVRRTRMQKVFSIEQREENLRNAFMLAPGAHAYEGQTLLLVDDVMTSGSTLIAASKQLSTMTQSIIAVVVSR